MEKYRIIEEYIKSQINDKKYKSGDKLPSEHELCKMFDISRITVRKALQNLANEGIIIRKVGDGTYVNSSNYVNVSRYGRSFSEDMIVNGKVPGSQLVDFKVCRCKNNEFIKNSLKLSDKDNFYMIIRIRTGDDIPVALSYTYIPQKLIPDFDIKKISGSLYDYFREKYDLNLHRENIVKTITAVMPNSNQKRLLRISDEPLLKICHPTELADGRLFEYTETFYVASRYILTYI